MGNTMVRYKVHPDRADENSALVRKVYAQLAVERPEGIHYATFLQPDGVSFMHVVFESEGAGRVLGALSAFQEFSRDIESRCEEPPVATELTLVGSYAFG
jgi:hypothetical protein